jgi:hypothetical protein
VSPKEVKKENKKLVYEKPVLIGLGDTLNLAAGACASGSYDLNNCGMGNSANKNCGPGSSPKLLCSTGTLKA